MKTTLPITGAALAVAAGLWSQTPAPKPAAPAALVKQYCVYCHSNQLKTGGLSLETLDPAHPGANAQTWEKVVRKLRAGMMPPSGMPRPDHTTFETFLSGLENELDHAAVTHLPPPGLHRLNRTEYANAVRDLLALEIDPAKFLPADDSTRGFDNIAGALSLSPALLEGYTLAAGKISRVALGDVTEATLATYRVPADSSQDYHLEGLPFGTRGGIVTQHEFPVDGDYVFKVFPINKGLMDNNAAFGEITGEKLELLVDGERVHLYEWDRDVARGNAVHGGSADVHFTVKAGQHTVGITFLATQLAPGNDLNQHFERSTIETGGLPGYKFYPHVGKLEILGPFKPAGAADSPSRRKIFVCKPLEGKEDVCAQEIVSTLARHAFRRPVTAQDTAVLMDFYRQGRKSGAFESGVEMALQRVLADPEFIFRKEAQPASVASGKTWRINDLELASRLSFFLWSSVPDDPLLTLAAANKLHDPAVLEQQVRRMLADERSDRLVVNFTGQWLNLRALQSWAPTTALYPDFDDNLRLAMRKETELFVGRVVHEDRSVIDLLNGDYTFLNERLARHYGIPNIYGSNFRRVALTPEFDMRRGLLGQASLQTISSQPQRTSPVGRGKTIMQIFLGVSPPDPPPGVEVMLKDQSGAAHGSATPSMRQQMEMHRKVEPCASCHKIMDPIGFSMENFDAIGRWRTHDGDIPIDAAGVLVDGSKLNGVAGMREALVRYSPQFVRVITEKLLIYALGRGTEYTDMPAVRSIVHAAEQNQYHFSSLILGIVKSDAFQMNQKIGSSDQ